MTKQYYHGDCGDSCPDSNDDLCGQIRAIDTALNNIIAAMDDKWHQHKEELDREELRSHLSHLRHHIMAASMAADNRQIDFAYLALEHAKTKCEHNIERLERDGRNALMSYGRPHQLDDNDE